MPSLLIVSLVVAVVWLVFSVRVRRPQVRCRESLARLLDLADEVEGLLTTSQKHMGALQSLLQRVPSDIGAVIVAGDSWGWVSGFQRFCPKNVSSITRVM